MTNPLPLTATYLSLPERFYTKQSATPVSDPKLIAFNAELARALDLNPDDFPSETAAKLLSGNENPQNAEPFAQVYAGHQFGGFSPQLGDGRALVLGEIDSPTLGRVDVQLKGSGPTPYSRMGDGRAAIGPVIREYVMSCAMQALGIPTTKALAVVTTGDPVLRENGPLPGAILTRIAASHIRVGTFQFFAARGDVEGLQALTDYTIERHYPDIKTPAELIEKVMEKQASLVAKWMGIGFIHGVMNTDNVTITGETIDYGPCAFMDTYHPDTVFSSIDQHGRYAYSNQPSVTHWNLAQFASCFVQLMADQNKAIEEFTAIINRFPALYQAQWSKVFAAKLGLQPGDEATQLAQDLLTRMAQDKLDFTNTFNALDDVSQVDAAWYDRWRAMQPDDALWQKTNPQIVPRLHHIEAAIQAAQSGDYAPFHALTAAMSDPFAPNPDYAQPPQDFEKVHRTFCGT
ncbi:MAG: YdiU family protein [Pseudomonadota bacterium]